MLKRLKHILIKKKSWTLIQYLKNQAMSHTHIPVYHYIIHISDNVLLLLEGKS